MIWGRSFVASNGVDLSVHSDGVVSIRRNVTELPILVPLEDLRAILSVHDWPQPNVQPVAIPERWHCVNCGEVQPARLELPLPGDVVCSVCSFIIATRHA